VLLGCCAIACGKPPIPVDSRTGEVLDPKYRPPAEARQVAGRVLLRGDLARAEQGTVFVILRERGSRIPARLRSYTYGGSEISDAIDGERRLSFKITDRDVLPGMDSPTPLKPELRVVYSPDGRIGANGGQISTDVQVSYGATDLEITLP
jgi:hypothetical protein